MAGLRYLLRKFLLCTVAVLVLMLPVAAPERVFSVATADEASAAIDVAQAVVTSCYQALVRAENAGGNVTELAGVLDGAGALLSRARVAFGRGEFDVAVEFSVNCRVELNGFTDRATALRDSAVQERGS